MLKRMRTLSIFMAWVGIAIGVAIQFISFDIGLWNEIAVMVAAVLVALGIITSNGAGPEKLTWAYIKDKAKSKIALNAIYVLVAFILYQFLAPETASIILSVMGSIIWMIFGVAVNNDPNNLKEYN